MSTLTQEEFDRLQVLKCGISYNRYGAYCVPLSSRHRPAAAMVMSGDVYEPRTIEFMRSNCKDGDIIHAGTYFGDFLPALAEACPGRIWAFEPNLENYRCAQITVLLNGIVNVDLRRSGLGSRRESLHLLTEDLGGLPRGGSSMFVGSDTSVQGRVELAPVVTIDESVPGDRNIAIIQLDVEGYEQPALAGALKTINRCRPVIIIEVLPESTLLSNEWFAKNIIGQGYHMTGTIHGNAILHPR